MLRRGETAELRWRNVQSAAIGGGGLLTIRRAKNDPDGRGAVNPISPLAMARLDAIRPQPPEPDALIFGLSEDAIRAWIKKVAERIGRAGARGLQRPLAARRTRAEPAGAGRVGAGYQRRGAMAQYRDGQRLHAADGGPAQRRSRARRGVRCAPEDGAG